LPAAENATIKMGAEMDTVEDPTIINESPSNSNSNSMKEADDNTKST